MHHWVNFLSVYLSVCLTDKTQTKFYNISTESTRDLPGTFPGIWSYPESYLGSVLVSRRFLRFYVFCVYVKLKKCTPAFQIAFVMASKLVQNGFYLKLLLMTKAVWTHWKCGSCSIFPKTTYIVRHINNSFLPGNIKCLSHNSKIVFSWFSNYEFREFLFLSTVL